MLRSTSASYQRLIVVAVLALGLGSCVREAPSHDAITIVAPRTAWSWPLYIAKQAGYYRQTGLDVDLVFANHPAGLAMVTSGDAEVNLLPLARALEVSSLDSSFIAVGAPVNKWLFALIAHKDVASVEKLKGKRLGIGQYGDATYTYALALLARFGLTLHDINIVVVGGDGRMPALASRQIDATMLSAPAWFRLEPYGFRSLADITEFEDIQAPSALIVKRETLRADPMLLRNLIQAHALAVKRFYGDRAFALAAHLAYDEQDLGELGRVYDAYRRDEVMDRVPLITSAGVESAIDLVADPSIADRLRALDYNALVDNSAVEGLIADGFFEHLFGAPISVHVIRHAGTSDQ